MVLQTGYVLYVSDFILDSSLLGRHLDSPFVDHVSEPTLLYGWVGTVMARLVICVVLNGGSRWYLYFEL